jgi:integrase
MNETDNFETALSTLRAMGIEPAVFAARLAASGEQHVENTQNLRDYVQGSVLAGLSKGKRKTWEPYMRFLIEGYDKLCACFCDECLNFFAGNSQWTPCPCVTKGTCSCTSEKLTVGSVRAHSCLEHCAGLGDKALRDIKKTDLATMANWAQLRAQKRTARRNRNHSAQGRSTFSYDGRSALELFRDATSCIYKLAIDDDVPGVTRNLALTLRLKPRPGAVARAYSDTQVEELWQAVFSSGGDDTQLDMLLVWFLFETGSRRSGPIGIRVGDLLFNSMKVRLSEKNGKVDEQPVSPALMSALLSHALSRGEVLLSNPLSLGVDEINIGHVIARQVTLRTDEPVMYYKRPLKTASNPNPQPHPLTVRKFDSLWRRLKKDLPWLDEIHGRPHDLRKTSATYIERAFGHSVAKAFLRHSVNGVTDLYTASNAEEVERAHRHLIGGG